MPEDIMNPVASLIVVATVLLLALIFILGMLEALDRASRNWREILEDEELDVPDVPEPRAATPTVSKETRR